MSPVSAEIITVVVMVGLVAEASNIPVVVEAVDINSTHINRILVIKAVGEVVFYNTAVGDVVDVVVDPTLLMYPQMNGTK